MDKVSSCISTVSGKLGMAGHTSLIISIDFKTQKLYHCGTGVGRNYLTKNKDALENFVRFCSETYSAETRVKEDNDTWDNVTVVDLDKILRKSMKSMEVQDVTSNREVENDAELTHTEHGENDVLNSTESGPSTEECVDKVPESEKSSENLDLFQTETEIKTEPDERSSEDIEDCASTEKSGLNNKCSSPRSSEQERTEQTLCHSLKFTHCGTLGAPELGEEDVFTNTVSEPLEDECLNSMYDNAISREDLGHLQTESEMKTELHGINLEHMEMLASTEKSGFDNKSSCPRRSGRKRKGEYGVIITKLKGRRKKECPQQSTKSRLGIEKKPERKKESASQQELLPDSCAKVFKSEMDLQFYKENECGTTSEEQSASSFKGEGCALVFPCQVEYANHFDMHAPYQERESCPVVKISDDNRHEKYHAYNLQETGSNLKNTHTTEKSTSNTIPENRTILDTISKSTLKFNKRDPHVCEVCGQTFKKAFGLNKHKMKHNDFCMFPCQFCNFTAKTKQILTKHLKKHQQLFYVCKVCGQGFPEKSKFIAHASSPCHSSKNVHSCEDHGNSYQDNQALKSHKKHHVKEHPRKCRFCGKLFSTSSNKKTHEKNHLNKKSYLCDFCGRSFNQKKNLDLHITERHKTNSDHMCSTCGKTFKIKKYLTAHVINMHLKPEDISSFGSAVFTCKICQKLFPDNYLLELHMNSHSGNRPFKCAICNAGFSGKGNMKAHQRRCKGHEKPFKCSICNKGFSSRQYMKTHQRRCSQLQKGPCSTEIPKEQLNLPISQTLENIS